MANKNDPVIVRRYRQVIMALFAHPDLMNHSAQPKQNILLCVRAVTGCGVSRSEFEYALGSLVRDGLLRRRRSGGRAGTPSASKWEAVDPIEDEFKARRPHDHLPEYFESDRDFIENNWEICLSILEAHHDASTTKSS